MVFFDSASSKKISEFLDESNSLTESEQLKFLIKEFCNKNIDVYMADLTTSDVEVSGVSVIRCVAPDMLANMPSAFPLLGNKRLQKILDGRSPNLFPLPHS